MTLLWLVRGEAGRRVPLVLVVVVAVGGVAVALMRVVDMVAVGNGLVPATGPVNVIVPGVSQVGSGCSS